MDKDHKQEIIDGIADYQSEQDELIALITEHGELSQDKFDEHYYSAPARLSPPTYPKAFVLMGDLRDRMLDLLQYMIAVDLVNAQQIDGKVYYSIPRKRDEK